jgi:hypothetical protein
MNGALTSRSQGSSSRRANGPNARGAAEPRLPRTAWLGLGLRNVPLLLALRKATRFHRAVERQYEVRLRRLAAQSMTLEFPAHHLRGTRYFSQNAFSILILSLLEHAGIDADRRLAYGLILHALRGIVTATDNILDRERKGFVVVRSHAGLVLPNVLLLLLHRGVQEEAVASLASPETRAGAFDGAILGGLADIAREEGIEEAGVESALAPADLLRNVLHFRGGRLLELAFLAPLVGETQCADVLRRLQRGIHFIGLALQVLDDVMDLAEDVAGSRHNMLRSWIVHQRPEEAGADGLLRDVPPAELSNPERRFPLATAEVVSGAMGLAWDGFRRLHEAGYPTDAGSALRLTELLFRIRGAQTLWALRDRAPSVAAAVWQV